MWPVREISVSLKSKNVNNKRIFKEVDEYVISILKLNIWNLRDESERTATVELLEDVLFEFSQTENSIEQIDVMCDKRNNVINHVRNTGEVFLTIRYKQKHCLNTTELAYTIQT